MSGRVRVCSGWSPSGRLQYGERFLVGFDKRWPKAVELQVYVEEAHDMPRQACRSLWDIPGAREFAERHKDNPDVRGERPKKGWKAGEVERKYSFRHDAFKFWKQMVIPNAASLDLADGDVVVWLDGDVYTFAPVPENLIDRVLHQADLAYLGREKTHSEIGFWALRISEQTREFLKLCADFYTEDRFLDLKEWHSAFVWDHCRSLMAQPITANNLSKGQRQGHVFPNTMLGRYMRHDKGARKPK